MQYHSFIWIGVRIVVLFHTYKASSSLSKGNGLFYRYHRRRLSFPSNLSISLSPTSVTTRLYCCYHRKLNPKPSYFHHLAGGRVAEVHEEASPNKKAKRAAIHNRLLTPRGGLARESVPQTFRYIYAPPQNCPRSGNAKQIFPLMGDAAGLARERMPDWLPIGGWGFGCYLLNAYAATRGH